MVRSAPTSPPLSHPNEGTAILDETGQFIQASQAFCEACGLTSNELKQTTLTALMTPFAGDCLPTLTDLRKGKPKQALVCIGGAPHLPPCTGQLILSRSEAGIQLQLHPLSTRPEAHLPKVGENPEGELSAALTRQQLDAVVRDMPGFCYTVGKDLVFRTSLGGGLEGLGLKPNQLVGTSLFDLWGTHDPNYDPFVHHIRALQGLPQTYQDVCLRRSLQYHLTPLWDESGNVIGIVGLGLDITEQQDAEREQARLNSQLQQAQRMESVGRLAGGVAHDFNNFLTCMMGNLSLLEEEVSFEGETGGYVSALNAALASAAQLTRQLLTLGRKEVVTPRPLDVGAVAGRVERLLRQAVGDGVLLRCAHPSDLWTVRADRGQLEQILVNLVVNARDAITGRGEIVMTTANEKVEAGSDLGVEPGEYVLLSVSDTGCGMSDLVQEQLFEPFFTTKDAREGTGLGLALVYSAVQQNQGSIAVDSKLGKGSTFRIYLPRVLEPSEEANLEPPTPTERPQGGTETLLLVEDEPALLQLASRSLQQLGYNVVPCSSPDEALVKFDDYGNRVDLLVTDMVMPRISGTELSSRLCALQPGLPVLYCSGYLPDTSTANEPAAENTAYLGKPYRQAALARLIRQLLDSANPPKPNN